MFLPIRFFPWTCQGPRAPAASTIPDNLFKKLALRTRVMNHDEVVLKLKEKGIYPSLDSSLLWISTPLEKRTSMPCRMSMLI
jgi:hypothetical protein